MIYNVTLKKRVIKALEKINEPYYSNIKEAIYSLADNPRTTGYKILKDRDADRILVTD
jgi:mRNA interferase RelE/StbE